MSPWERSTNSSIFCLVNGILNWWMAPTLLSAGMEISCPSAWTSLSGYME